MTTNVQELLPGTTIGIIGAGQLGKMLAQSAQKMGYRVAMLDPNPTACGFGVCHEKIVAPFTDREALMQLANSCDVITYEFENIDGPLLVELESIGNLPQKSDMLLNSQQRIQEKTWLRSLGLPTVDFVDVSQYDSIQAAIEALGGLPAVLKTTRFGYDGKGQVLIKDAEQLIAQQEEIQSIVDSGAILETFSSYEKEVSVMVVRDGYGSVEVFPVSENLHLAGILAAGHVPAQVDPSVIEQVESLARHFAEQSNLIGLCGIEFFVLANGDVQINEIAPRPHNSGHYTIEGTNVSQYDQHILAITGRRIIPIELIQETLMVNILGQHMPKVPQAMHDYPEAMYHLYDKGEAKVQRKMGHLTFQAENIQPVRERFEADRFWQQWCQSFKEGELKE